MDGHAVEQREVFIAVAGDMGSLHLVVEEVAEQRRGKPPLRIRGTLCGDGAEVSRHAAAQCQSLVAAVDLTAQQFKVDEQSLLVVHYLRLMGGHAHIGSIAVAHIVDEQCKLSGYHRLYHVLRERVVAQDVALHKVDEVELRRRLHGEGDGLQVARHDQSGVGVGV